MRGRDSEAEYVGDFGVERRHGDGARLILACSVVLLAAGDGLDAASDQSYYLALRLCYLFARQI